MPEGTQPSVHLMRDYPNLSGAFLSTAYAEKSVDTAFSAWYNAYLSAERKLSSVSAKALGEAVLRHAPVAQLDRATAF